MICAVTILRIAPNIDQNRLIVAASTFEQCLEEVNPWACRIAEDDD
jgi:hypothetical protein